ncbi:MAG: uracil-DNA glycosylase [Candidatus Ratteibacteria bacterium]
MKSKKLKEIEKEAKLCKKCHLYKKRKNVVFGSGNPYSKVIFIGEAPGKNEDEKGIPFCGKAGEILDFLLDTIGLKRKNVYITNVVKCRPPGNRRPKKNEIEKCKEYLIKQIEIIKPKIICCLGDIALKFIFENYSIKKNKGITEMHGRIIKLNNFKVFPVFHPAYAIYNRKILKVMRDDFKKLKEFLC